MRTAAPCCIVMVAAITSSHATPIEMVCESPRQEYVVTFDPSTRAFQAGETPYRVLAVENEDDHFVVMGHTVGDGPFFRAHFRPYLKIEFYASSGVPFQTDGCRE